jgi:hypothetical protein
MGNDRIRVDKRRNATFQVWGPLKGLSTNIDNAIHPNLLDILNSGDTSKLTLQSDLDHYDRWKWVKGKINSLGFRSDEFTDSHDGLHVIFSGDSNTFGEGLERSEMWSSLVLEELSKTNKVSGYFNLGSPGTSIMTSVMNIFKYMNAYGKPNLIFINLTELSRFYDYVHDEKRYATTMYESGFMETIRLVAYDYYFMLQTYCKSNDIQLYSFTWDTDSDRVDSKDYVCTNDIFNKQEFDTFYALPNSTVMWREMFDKYDKSFIDQEFFQTARDGSHFGIGPNMWWADKMISAYMKRNQK